MPPIKPIILYITYLIIEKLETFQSYRKLKGGIWYNVVDLETGEPRWTRDKWPLELGLTTETEDYTNNED